MPGAHVPPSRCRSTRLIRTTRRAWLRSFARGVVPVCLCQVVRQPPRDYRLIKELWAFHENRIAVLQYEGMTIRAIGSVRTATSSGNSMRTGRREASINDVPILASDRKFHWPAGPRKPSHHKSDWYRAQGPILDFTVPHDRAALARVSTAAAASRAFRSYASPI
jgi:Protein of unknown function (DUF1348)